MEYLRPSAVAGTFYPGEPVALAEAVDQLLAEVEAAPILQAPKALIVPHAGYVYSGPIAATAYAQLRSFADQYRRVVLVGPAHRVRLHGAAASGADAFVTPLGRVPVEPTTLVHADPLAHAKEHSLEVQLPFLQRVLPNAVIVPLVVGSATSEELGRILDELWGGPETLIVISSDLSHYLPYADARAQDRDTVRRIERKAQDLVGQEACGAVAINGLAWVATRRHLHYRLLDLRSSGDTSGERDQVVGYASFAAYEEGAPDAAC